MNLIKSVTENKCDTINVIGRALSIHKIQKNKISFGRNMSKIFKMYGTDVDFMNLKIIELDFMNTKLLLSPDFDK